MSRMFNGTSDYIEHGAAVVGSVPITMACWFYTDDLASARSLISCGDAAADTKVLLFVNSGSGGVTATTVAVGGASAAASSFSGTSIRVWTHACAVVAGATSRAVFVSGVLKSTNTTSIVLGTPTVTSIGTRYTAGVRGAFMDGLIAEAAIWDVALNNAEVYLLACGYHPSQIRPVSLKAYWPLVGQYSPNELDCKGRFDGVVNGAKPVIANHPPLIPRTRRHRALDLLKLKLPGVAVTGVMGTGALGTVIPLLPPQQPGAIVFTRQIG